MKKVEIVFRFLGIPVRIIRQIPGEIEGLTEHEYLTVFMFMFGKINERQLLSRFFRLPPLVSWFVFVRKYWRYKLLGFMEPLMDFTTAADHFIVKNMPGGLNCSCMKFKGITFMQFMFADTMYTQYLQSRDKNHLYAFIASLYLHIGESFKQVDIEQRIKFLAGQSLPDYLLNAVLVNYMMQKKWLTTVYPFMFSNAEESEASSHKQQQNWVQIFDAFVGEHIPDTEYYKEMSCMDAFRLINNRMKNYNRHGK